MGGAGYVVAVPPMTEKTTEISGSTRAIASEGAAMRNVRPTCRQSTIKGNPHRTHSTHHQGQSTG